MQFQKGKVENWATANSLVPPELLACHDQAKKDLGKAKEEEIHQRALQILGECLEQEVQDGD